MADEFLLNTFIRSMTPG